MYNQFNLKLDLLLVNIRSFLKMRDVKQLKRGGSIVYGYQWLINLRLFLPIFVNLLGIFS